MKQLIGLTIFEVKQFFKDKMGLFWTFLFPFVLLALMSLFYGSMNKSYQKFDPLLINFCGSDERFNVVHDAVDRYYNGIFRIVRTDVFKLDYDGYLVVVPLNCPGVQTPVVSFDQEPSNFLVFSKYKDLLTRALLQDVLNRDLSIEQSPITFVDQDPEKDGIDSNSFLVSGIITMTLASITLFGISLWIVQMRSNNVFTKYKLFPIDSYKLIIAFICSRTIFMCTYIVIFMGVCLVVFKIDVSLYSVPGLILFSLLGVVTFISLGVFLSGLFRSSAAAAGVINIIYLLITFPSNLFMPDRFFPVELSDIMGFLPVKAFVEGFRVIAFGQDEIYSLEKSTIVLIVWLVVSFVLAIKTFRWGSLD
jgi:ABC-2 type transport system permease protein